MDLLKKEGAKLAPKDHAEEIAIFRAQVIGPLLTREFTSRGELAEEIRRLARVYHRPPGLRVSRKYSQPTIEH